MQIDLGHQHPGFSGRHRILTGFSLNPNEKPGETVVTTPVIVGGLAAISQSLLLGTGWWLGGAGLWGALVLSTLVAWALAEAAVGARVQRPQRQVALRWLTVTQATVCLAALWTALATPSPVPWPFVCIGLLAVAAGATMRTVAIATLGPLFLDDVALLDQHPRVSHGLFRWVRHPALLGVCLICAGTAMATGSGVAVGVVTVGVLPVAAARFLLEERLFAERRAEDHRQTGAPHPAR